MTKAQANAKLHNLGVLEMVKNWVNKQKWFQELDHTIIVGRAAHITWNWVLADMVYLLSTVLGQNWYLPTVYK